MKSLLITLGSSLLLTGGSVGGWWWAKRSAAEPAMAEMKQADVLYWYDPMYPQQHFDKPGKSPFMDMELVPRLAGDSRQNVGVQVSSAVTQSLGVRLATVEHTAVGSRIDASGLLGFDERATAVVQSRTAGFVEKVWPVAVGDQVKAGAPLVQLLVPEWATAQQEFLAVRSSGDAALLDAARDRLRFLGMDEDAVHQLEAAGVAQSRFILRAPISGVVRELELRRGMTAAAGQTLLRLNGLTSIWLEVAIPESLAASVQVGDSAEVRLAGVTATVDGRVSAVLPTLSDATRTLRIRVELPNRDGTLRPGQSAQVALTATQPDAVLSVPTEAVIRTGKRSLVILAAQGSYRPVEVSLGREVGDRTVIESGLNEGQQVVASGQFLLDSEASLRGLGLPATEDGK
ncbi:MAG: efflux RND transporter periplasmic adaptor subunit [Pseudomonadota bacterium]